VFLWQPGPMPEPTSNHTAIPARFSLAWFLLDDHFFWERGRLVYNIVQLLISFVMIGIRWSNAQYFTSNLGTYFAAALFANFYYTAVYLAELPLLLPALRPYARILRVCILIAGTAFAGFLTVMMMDAAILVDPARD
jgi:hypothetical protein